MYFNTILCLRKYKFFVIVKENIIKVYIVLKYLILVKQSKEITILSMQRFVKLKQISSSTHQNIFSKIMIFIIFKFYLH